LTVDEVDEQLIRVLQRDGRASYETLADAAGLARSSVRSRVRRLLDSGRLRIIGAVHPSVFGLAELGHVTIEIDGPARPVADRVAALPETSFVTTTAGRFAVTAELRTADPQGFADGLASIQAIDGVRRAAVVRYLRIWKDPYFPPGTFRPITLDAADHALMERLRTDGRASFAELAGVSGLSSGATRTRVLRLLDAGVVHVGALVRLDPLSPAHTFGFALQLDSDADPVAEQISGLAEVDSLVVGLGWCNAIGTIRVESYEQVSAALERIRDVAGVRSVESWAHLRAIKEENDLTDAPDEPA
jgi:DNA-binding Lrp family transcriptional regulator